MLKSIVAASCLTLAFMGAAHAQVKRTGAPTAVISSVVTVPAGYETVYVAGTTANMPGQPITESMDTKAQTLVVLTKLKDALAAEKLTFADVVMARVYLVGTPATGGRMDAAGMNEAFRQFFGSPDQPNKPARTTVQVAALGSPTTLVEIDLTAVRKP